MQLRKRVNLLAVLTAVLVTTLPGVLPAQSAAPPFTIGVSNGFVASEWRTQMIDNMKAVDAGFMKAGLTKDLLIQSSNTDVPGQIQQIRNLILSKVNGIIINPNSQSGLNQVIREAVNGGIPVVPVDQEVSAREAVNVTINQKEWAMISARWLATTLKGKGSVVIINGVAGHPANEARYDGVKEVFAKYPGITVVNVSNADWDQVKGQQVMARLIASYPTLDGVWTQDGMAEGALRALLAANLSKLPVLSGEARAGYLRLWAETKKKYSGFHSIGVYNPPGVGVSGLRVLVRLLQGKKLKDGIFSGPFKNTLYVPIPGRVTDDNLTAELKKIEGKPDTYVLDGWITDKQADSFFK